MGKQKKKTNIKSMFHLYNFPPTHSFLCVYNHSRQYYIVCTIVYKSLRCSILKPEYYHFYFSKLNEKKP